MQTQNCKVHQWLKTVQVSFMPATGMSGLLPDIFEKLNRAFARNNHVLADTPTKHTDIVISTGEFGKPISFQNCTAFKLRRRFAFSSAPEVIVVTHLRNDAFDCIVTRLAAVLNKEQLERSDFHYPGLSRGAYKVLSEQGKRGGAVLALARIMQAQLKCLRIVLFVGDEQPSTAYHFDLVGSTARTTLNGCEDRFYDDIVHRIATTASTRLVTDHEHSDTQLPLATWNQLDSVRAMCKASQELNRRRFFTDAVEIGDIVDLPTVSEGVTKQYSEGCYATWDPSISSLVSTITGAAKPVNKGNITHQDLVPIARINNARNGVLYHKVKGKSDHPPTSEAYELLVIDEPFQKLSCPLPIHRGVSVPLIRSKLHGHRGVRSYDPARVEYAPLDETFFRYPVTCGTEAQGQALRDAFSKAQALRNPDDPRMLVFTILPCHGIFILEKWSDAKEPFECIWESMDGGAICVEDAIPQEFAYFETAPNGNMILKSY